MFHRRIDLLVRSLLASSRRFQNFQDGWGDLALVSELTQFGRQELLNKTGIQKVIQIPKVTWSLKDKPSGDHTVSEGHFESTFKRILPPESQTAHFRLVLPRQVNSAAIPVAVLLPPTGDHGYYRRYTTQSVPLARHGIGTLLLEIPYYGTRRPALQFRSALRQVSDLVTMGAALISEVNSLIAWLRTDSRFGPFAVSGVSLGGQMAALAGVLSPYPIAVVPCLAPHNAGPVFTEGPHSLTVDWQTLSAQLPAQISPELLPTRGDSPWWHDALSRASDRVERSKAFMAALLDITDLRHYPLPPVPEAATVVSAMYDAYTPNSGEILSKHWNCEVRYLPSGHCSSFFLHNGAFNLAIRDSIERLRAANVNHRSVVDVARNELLSPG